MAPIARATGPTLTLRATVDNGVSMNPAAPEDFILVASGPGWSTVRGASATPDTTLVPVAAGSYTLSVEPGRAFTPLWVGCSSGEFTPASIMYREPAAIQIPADSDADIVCDVTLTAQVLLHVTAGGDRAPDGTITGVAGVHFTALAYYQPVRFRPDELPVLTQGQCTTDATGSCDLALDVIQPEQQAQGYRFWVAEAGPAPAGWTLGLEGGRTPGNWVGVDPAASGTVIDVASTGALYRTTRILNSPFPVLRPSTVPSFCRASLRVAIAVDTSSSMAGKPLQLAKRAATTIVGSTVFGGTATRASIFSFGAVTTKFTPVPLPLSSAFGRAVATGVVASLGAAKGSDTTDRDRLNRRLAAEGPWDLIVVISDGIPSTVIGPGQDPAVFAPLFSANVIRAQVGPAGQPTGIYELGAGQVGTFAGDLRDVVDHCAATLTLVNSVSNGTTGGRGSAADWVLGAAGPITLSGTSGDAGLTEARVPAGRYRLSASTVLRGYVASGWTCAGASVAADGTLDLAISDDVVCSIQQVAQPATWRISLSSSPAVTARPGDIVSYTARLRQTGGVSPAAVSVYVQRSLRLAPVSVSSSPSGLLNSGYPHILGDWLATHYGQEAVATYTARVKQNAAPGQATLTISGPVGAVCDPSCRSVVRIVGPAASTTLR